MRHYLVLSGLGPDKPGIARELSAAAFETGLSLEDSRMAVLGGEFAILVLLAGDKHGLESFSRRIEELEAATGLSLNLKPTLARPEQRVEAGAPVRISVVGMDRTGIVFRVTNLLIRHGINIDSLETAARHAPVTGSPMFHLELTAAVPEDVSLRGLREELASLCDEMNLDYTLEALS
ncbi:ACT domain-containing protein [bacterium]|nr:ACT domain-containing protein [bacterium]